MWIDTCNKQINMKGKQKIRGKSLTGTPFFLSKDEKIGQGAYGQVFRVYNTQHPSQQLVVKVLSLLQSDNKQSIQTQVQMLHELPHHQNLVNCIKAHIASENNLYIIMQYCNQGCLETFIKKMTLLPQQKIWDILTQICRGYQVLYDAKLIHRDIKPDNILIHNKVFKLADFGLGKKIKDHKLEENLSYAGSPLYIAPEIVDKNQGTSKIDVYSLGSVLYELAYDGNAPFFTDKDKYNSPYDYYAVRKSKQFILKPRNKKGQPRSQQLRDLIASMLAYDPDQRIGWPQIFKHNKIDIDGIQAVRRPLDRKVSFEEEYLQELRKSMQVVSRSSAELHPIVQKPNVREESSQLTLELISFEEFLSHSELKSLEHEMFRLKITQLTILHCGNKITYLFQQNQHHRGLHTHIVECLQKIVIEGLLYLLKINHTITNKISGYDESIMKDLNKILQNDRKQLIQEFRKEAAIFKHLQLQKELQNVEKYDLRRYEDELYGILTQYCDFPQAAKQKVSVIISILLDIYDSSLKLTDIVQSDRVVWQKYQDMNEIQTKMDQFCYNKLQPHEFYSYLLKKEQIKLQENNITLKKLGLLFA